MRDLHTVRMLDGSNGNISNGLVMGVKKGVANSIGAGAGEAVATVVTFDEPIPPNAVVLVSVHQDATASVGTFTQTGFTVTLRPRLAASTLAAGTFDVVVLG